MITKYRKEIDRYMKIHQIGFYAKKVSDVKSKSLYSVNIDGAQIQTYCQYDLNTNHIEINTEHIKLKKIRQIRKPKPLNKDSTVYLGVNVAEKLLSNLFQNKLEIMPYGNRGYDFICGKGLKIDSKCSTLHKDGKWSFSINKNTTADYFACIAMDDRENLTPIHFWLIPGKDVNTKASISIAPHKIDKWIKYWQPLDKIFTCCTEMKVNRHEF